MIDPVISIIFIEYFSLEELALSISRIKKELINFRYEIIISSNSCYDEHEKQSVKNRFKDVEWIFNERNGGFAFGMNQGLKKARGRFLVIANPDAVVIEGFDDMIRFMMDHQEVGAVGPQMIDSKGEIQDSYRGYVTIQSYFLRQLRRAFRKIPVREKGIDPSLVQTVDWLSGAFIMVSRDAFEKTNGLDEIYFMYAEDMDWCTRIRLEGYEIVYFPKMKLIFSGSRNARKLNNYTLTFIKSHLIFWKKFGYFSGCPERKLIVYDIITRN